MRSPETNPGPSQAWRLIAAALMLVLGIAWFWFSGDSAPPVAAEARAPTVGQRGAAPGTTVKRQPQAPTPFVRSGGANADSGDFRASARKAVPVTRGKELDTRFRPDDRASPYGGVGAAADPLPLADDIDFRPLPQRRRPTYEELQAEDLARQPPPVPALPMPLLPGMHPGPVWRP